FKKIVHHTNADLTDEIVSYYLQLDDVDLLYMLKQGMSNHDKILSILCKNIIHRRLFTTRLNIEKTPQRFFEELQKKIAETLHISEEETSYFLIEKEEDFREYNSEKDEIRILMKDGRLLPFSEVNPEYSHKPLIKKF